MDKAKLWKTLGSNIITALQNDPSYKEVPPSALPKGFLPVDYHLNKYLEWVVRSYLDGGIKLYEDIQTRVYPALRNFTTLVNQGILSGGEYKKPWTDETNILNFCGIEGCTQRGRYRGGLESLLERYKEHLQTLNDDGKMEPYYEGQTLTIYRPENAIQARRYGRGTKWCTSTRNLLESSFDSYNYDGPLYIVIPKHPSYKGEKYQLQPGSFTYMNEEDKRVIPSELFEKYPELNQVEPLAEILIGLPIIKDGDFRLYLKSDAREELVLYDGPDTYQMLLAAKTINPITPTGSARAALRKLAQRIDVIEDERLAMDIGDFLLAGGILFYNITKLMSDEDFSLYYLESEGTDRKVMLLLFRDGSKVWTDSVWNKDQRSYYFTKAPKSILQKIAGRVDEITDPQLRETLLNGLTLTIKYK